MNDIENGMLVDAAAHDVQQHEPQGMRCYVCGGVYPPGWLIPIDGKLVCEECELGYFRSRVDDYKADFIAAHENEFYREYWWDDLPKELKLSYIKEAYQREKIGEYFPELERDFCLDDPDWAAFMRDELS